MTIVNFTGRIHSAAGRLGQVKMGLKIGIQLPLDYMKFSKAPLIGGYGRAIPAECTQVRHASTTMAS